MTPSKICSLVILCLLTVFSCKQEKKATNESYTLTQNLVRLANYDEGFPLTEEDVDAGAPYKTEDFKQYYSDFYKDKKSAPPFNYEVDLTTKSFHELRLLRAEILARHGFLFMDYVLRSHFNATNWYQPVFWYPDFKIKLSEQEKKFIEKVLVFEKKLYQKNYIKGPNGKIANTQNVVNWQQFDPIPTEMMTHLKKDGFVINKGKYEQLFHVYDENHYDYTPSFLTTDLFLQVLHMHISKEMQAIEEEKLFTVVNSLMADEYALFKKEYESAKNPIIKKACAWNQVYFAVALSLISGKEQEVPSEYKDAYAYEFEHAQKGQGQTSDFLADSLIDYTQFQPRGNYTRTDSLKQYFKCVRWLSNASIYIDSDEGLIRAILMGNSLLKSNVRLKNYSIFSSIIQFLAGDENNLSLAHICKVLNQNNSLSAEELIQKVKLEKIRTALYSIDPKIMVPKGANEKTDYYLTRKKIVFAAGRYTFDGEIMQRLINIARADLKVEPIRPFPKSLDVFATMGNKTAEDILINVFKEKQNWPAYTDTLENLKRKLKGFNDWDKSVYNKTMETILSLQKPVIGAPYFMQIPNWQKKNLNSMLGSWTGLKHDMILYIEQPSGAEMGDGGEIPPPQKIAYVEPQIDFWKKCISLLTLNKKMLADNGLLTAKLDYRNTELINIAELFVRISEKELTGKHLSNAEFDSLSFMGGRIESLTLSIIESNEGFVSSVSTPERYMAIATDVYTYNDNCLEEAVGMGDEIYVIVEINGLLYLSRGAVFSQYEFIQPSSNRLTDEDWQKQLLDGKEPKTTSWMKDIKIEIPQVKTAPNFNLY